MEQVAGDQLLDVGHDASGLLLEVIAVPDNKNPGGLAVIHAMPVEWRKNWPSNLHTKLLPTQANAI